MNLVMDTLFADTLEFTMRREDYAQIIMPSLEQKITEAARFVGLELVSYETAQVQPIGGTVKIFVVGGLWVKQQQR